jgi:hypothetical protein
MACLHFCVTECPIKADNRNLNSRDLGLLNSLSLTMEPRAMVVGEGDVSLSSAKTIKMFHIMMKFQQNPQD